MTALDLLRRVVGALDQAGIPYMLTGSFAAAAHGVPRATQDLDLVIAPAPDQLRRLVRSFPAADFYVSATAAEEALRNEGLFNLIDLTLGWKVDFIIRKSRPFSRQEFERRITEDVEGLPVAVATIEDLVIAKLEWHRMGASGRQLDDAIELLALRGPELDLDYLVSWVNRLGLEEQWHRARRAAGIGSP